MSAPLNRSAFVASAAAFAATAGRASAGSRDAEPAASPWMRVLLGSAVGQVPDARAVDADSFRYDGRTYRGRFASVALPDGRIGLLDWVPLEQYLYSVVSREIPSSWAPSALQAQAIVARTYALTKQRPGKAYDVVASESDQSYPGIEAETAQAREAVDATAGKIVTYEGKPARIAYGSCCGGHTADAAELWGTAYPYLRGVPDPYCSPAPDFHWVRTLPYDEFVRALWTVSAGDVDRVELRDLDSSGRPRTVALFGARGETEMKISAFRNALGTQVVRSTLVQSVSVDRNGTVNIAGSGHGHGVGLCQWGAKYLARGGYDAENVVRFYFPGTAVGSA